MSLILDKTAKEAGAIGMNPVAFVQAMLPHQEVYLRGADGEPVEIPDGRGGTQKLLASHYSATNGEYRLTITAGTTTGTEPPPPRGLTWHPQRRTRAAPARVHHHRGPEGQGDRREDSLTIDLGRTLTAFCERVDITPSGGENGRLRYVIDQVQRLATCSVNYEWDTYKLGRKNLDGDNLFVVDSYRFFHQGATETSEPIDGGSITLSQKFWDGIASDSFPMDFRKAQFFRGRPTAYDLYLWLTFRLERLRRSGKPHFAVNYDQLHAQLGSHYQTDEDGALTPRGKKDFGWEIRKALKAIAATWPALRYDTPRGRVVVYDTGPDVEYRPPKRTG